MHKKEIERAFLNACEVNGRTFELLWMSGGALEDDNDEIVDYAAKCIIACMYIQDHSGFILRRTAKKIRGKVEKAMIEVQLSRKLAIRVRELFEAEGYAAGLQSSL